MTIATLTRVVPTTVRNIARAAPSVQSESATRAPRSTPYEHGGKRTPLAERVAAAMATPSAFPSLAAVERDYPHLVPKIRAAWGSPDRFARLMGDLLLADRDGRQGFTPDAIVELTRLWDYYERQVADAGTGRLGSRWPER